MEDDLDVSRRHGDVVVYQAFGVRGSIVELFQSIHLLVSYILYYFEAPGYFWLSSWDVERAGGCIVERLLDTRCCAVWPLAILANTRKSCARWPLRLATYAEASTLEHSHACPKRCAQSRSLDTGLSLSSSLYWVVV